MIPNLIHQWTFAAYILSQGSFIISAVSHMTCIIAIFFYCYIVINIAKLCKDIFIEEMFAHELECKLWNAIPFDTFYIKHIGIKWVSDLLMAN